MELPRTSRLARLYAAIVDTRTGSGWRLPALDGLRGVAAMMVLIAHAFQRVNQAPNWFLAPIERGGLGGVILFFSLSGFLLYLPWLRSEVEGMPAPEFRTYAIRRCLRIMPAYYMSVLAVLVLRMTFGARDPLTWDGLALHFVFLPTLISPLQTVYWTLQVEEFFYWLLPLLHRLRLKIGALGVLGIVCLVSAIWGLIGLALFSVQGLKTWLENTPFFLPVFALGIYAAMRWRAFGLGGPAAGGAGSAGGSGGSGCSGGSGGSGFSGRTLVITGALAYVALAPVSLYFADLTDAWNPVAELLFAPAAAMVVLGVARGGAPILEHPALRLLGAISYSIYLWHMVVIRNLPLPSVIAHSFPLRVIVTSVVTIAISTIFYLCVERPFLRLRPHSRKAEPAS